MIYGVCLEFAAGRSRGNERRSTSKEGLYAALEALHEQQELFNLASNVVFRINGKLVNKSSTSLSLQALKSVVDSFTNKVGNKPKMRNGRPTSVYLPEGLKAVLRARGNGSVSAGLVDCLKDCGDQKVIMELGL